MSTEIRTIELDPATWLHLEGTERSFLLRADDGKQCCMGVMCSAYALDPARLHGTAALGAIEDYLPVDVAQWHGENYGDMGQLYNLNDKGTPNGRALFVEERTDAALVEDINNWLERTNAPFRFTLKEAR